MYSGYRMPKKTISYRMPKKRMHSECIAIFVAGNRKTGKRKQGKTEGAKAKNTTGKSNDCRVSEKDAELRTLAL